MPITDAGIEHLAQLKNLEHIWLNHCERVTDAGLRYLEGLRRLIDGDRVDSTCIRDAKAPARPHSASSSHMRTARERRKQNHRAALADLSWIGVHGLTTAERNAEHNDDDASGGATEGNHSGHRMERGPHRAQQRNGGGAHRPPLRRPSST